MFMADIVRPVASGTKNTGTVTRNSATTATRSGRRRHHAPGRDRGVEGAFARLSALTSRGGNAGVRREAAVGHQRGAGDERGVVGGQEADRGGDLVRGAETSERMRLLQPLAVATLALGVA